MASSTSSGPNEDYFFGWNLFYNTIIREVNKKSDVLIALAHFILAKHLNFRCLGNGDKMTFSDEEEGSELLPIDWNQDEFKYSLRYLVYNQLYLLLGHISEESLIINLLIADSKIVSNINLHPDSLVKTTEVLDLYQLIPQANFISKRYNRELIDPVFKTNKRNKSLQTDPQPSSSISTYAISDSHRNLADIDSGHLLHPLDIDREDLNHFPYGGPGNLIPFPLHPDFGPEFRFDPDHPFGPPLPLPSPNPNGNQNPNPDLFPPVNSNTNINPDLFPPPRNYYM
ncbi:proteasome inhibitor PI31 subunit-like [Teleopsis dalmanni]|uniref:proteasome inhibitor PI31 subunit-like n=1 Tax=Teleopsis dalmanni TaxID=139649 RepID=UPI0018CFED1B|nr:proteasome inhibitor PI31 subunit-like [Teleopsis dalmanni]